MVYRCDDYYDPAAARAVRFDDPEIAITWPDVELIASARDTNAPRLAEIRDDLPFVYDG